MTEPKTMSYSPEQAPKGIYIDQNVYGHMLKAGNGDWKSSVMGELLEEARVSKKGVVWAGPTNVIETMQASDPSLRRSLAGCILELTDARRMWWGCEFEAVDDFFFFLEAVAPGSVRTRVFFEHFAINMRQLWIGGLALLATGHQLNISEAVSDLYRLKLTNRLLHARLMSDANGWVDKIVEAAQKWDTTIEDVFSSFDSMSIEEMTNEVEQLKHSVTKLDSKHLQKLKKNRAQVASAYGAVELGTMLTSVFTLPLSLQLTLSADAIVKAWPQIKIPGKPSLKKEVALAADGEADQSVEMFYDVLTSAMRLASTDKVLMTGYLGYEVVINELQKCSSDGEVPTGGLTFDADHAAALKRFDIMVCQDEKLANTMKTLAKDVAVKSNGQVSPVVVSTESQLQSALK